jgi:DNA-binding transcriptional ArsR family regulator
MIALLDGRALTAGELAYVASVTPPTTSGRLAKMIEARLLTLTQQGRHCHYCRASPPVARMLESLMAVAVDGPARYRPRWWGKDTLRMARTC